jgi:5-methylcytosine-specific restriction enzyme A
MIKQRKPLRRTGPLKKIRDLVKNRATVNGVPMCELCGKWAAVTNIHHRQPRGIGGCRLPYINQPSNLLLVCGHGSLWGCHAVIETRREYARSMHWLVPRPLKPVDIPVWRRGELVWLRDAAPLVIAADLAKVQAWLRSRGEEAS